ncbi:hypothetical protein F5Y18DRAFT_18328 [Xylariaceae sp. FL1019]|nr:hypothetical protein F5Y18DRAFT_18328 [Xylariaceae sp. FL1019]
MASSDEGRPASPAEPTSPNQSKKRKTHDEIEVDVNLPEPPSKKAKRLLKKGKTLPVKPTSDDEADDGLPIPKTKDPKEKKRSDYGIWIGNLAFTMTRTDLFKWIVEASGGAIKEENVTRVNLPLSKNREAVPVRPHRGDDAPTTQRQNKGFAYIDFDTEAAAVAAMSLTETELNGRKVLIKNATSFEGRPQKESAPAVEGGENGTKGEAAPANTSKKIYVGNLSFQVTEDDVRAQFEKCGEIEWLKVATFEDSGKCKGFGWVKFKEAEAAEWAVKGFVKIKEEIETEDDFREDGDEDGDTKKQEKKYQMRKWWVNRLHGRELKIELAEDDQTRYKKRYGKGAQNKGGRDRDTQQPDTRRPAAKREDGGIGKTAAKPAYGDAAVASYKTGAVVKPAGKKVTFD